MLIKILERGWENFTGDLGMAQFVNGVSVTHMSIREARSLGASIRIIEVDEYGNEGSQISDAFDMVRQQEITSPVVVQLRTVGEIEAEEAAIEAERALSGGDAPVELHVFTKQELEEIATEKGIAGIREVADPLGIKGVSIRALIAEILVKQPKA